MSHTALSGKSQTKTLEKRKAELKSQLEHEDRISRRQELFKKIWKIEKQQQAESADEEKTVFNS